MDTRFMIRKVGFIRIAIASLVILSLISIGTYGQKNSQEKEWWYPIIQKHKVELQAYNAYEKVFEMGTTNTIDNRIVTLENAFFLLIETDDNYSIVTFPLAYHDLDKGIIEGNNCTWESFSIKSENIKPTERVKCRYLRYDLKSHKGIIMDIENPI